MKNEKINAEMEKFWDRRMDKFGGDGSDSAEDADSEVDEAEFKKVCLVSFDSTSHAA